MAHAQPIDERAVTVPDLPDQIVVGSSYGEGITNMWWHWREGERFASHGDPCFIGRNGGGRIALYRGMPLKDEQKQVLAVFEGAS